MLLTSGYIACTVALLESNNIAHYDSANVASTVQLMFASGKKETINQLMLEDSS